MPIGQQSRIDDRDGRSPRWLPNSHSDDNRAAQRHSEGNGEAQQRDERMPKLEAALFRVDRSRSRSSLPSALALARGVGGRQQPCQRDRTQSVSRCYGISSEAERVNAAKHLSRRWTVALAKTTDVAAPGLAGKRTARTARIPGSAPPQFRFAHLSDVHFRREIGGDIWDLDADLRNELEIDLARMVDELGPFTGILITGDIAFSGKPEEYEEAAAWLGKICAIIRCRENDIWIVPGNHDVDWSVVQGSPTIQEFHERLRTCPQDEIDGLIYRYLVADQAGGDAYFAPLRNYNAFAARYGCSVSASKPYWEDRLPIGDSGAFLRLRGVTTAIVSDHTDDPDGRRLVAGSIQTLIPREPRTLTATLAHHPISWLRDGERVDNNLRTRARIQLWGHRHTQQARMLDENLHLFAGAVHPERGILDWEPRYNVIDIAADDTSPASVVLRPRVWRRATQKFGADFDDTGSPVATYTLAFDAEPGRGPEAPEGELSVSPPRTEPLRDARRSLAFAFSSLPYQRRLAVARALDLLDPESRDLPDQQLFEVVLSRALRGDRLAELWVRVQRERGGEAGPNPFAEGQDAPTSSPAPEAVDGA